MKHSNELGEKNGDGDGAPRKFDKVKSHTEKSILKPPKNYNEQNLKNPNGNGSKAIGPCEIQNEENQYDSDIRQMTSVTTKSIDSLLSIFKKDAPKPVQLEFLKQDEVTDRIMNYRIPKKVRIDDNPEVKIIDKSSPPRKKKRKLNESVQSLPSTASVNNVGKFYFFFVIRFTLSIVWRN